MNSMSPLDSTSRARTFIKEVSAGRCSDVRNAVPCDLVTGQRAGSRDVQGLERADEGDANDQVAALAGQPREAMALGSEHECDRLSGDIAELEEGALGDHVEP